MTTLKIATRLMLSVLFLVAGVAHFRTPEPFVKIVPPMLPAPYLLVYLSGLFEILGGLGLLVPAGREIACWGLVALLLAVFPANIYMAVAGIKFGGFPSQAWMAWARLPLQFVLIWLVVWSTQE